MFFQFKNVAASPLPIWKEGGVSCKCVCDADTYGPLKGWPEVTHNMEGMRGLVGNGKVSCKCVPDY